MLEKVEIWSAEISTLSGTLESPLVTSSRLRFRMPGDAASGKNNNPLLLEDL